jgi:hypothetical protein
MSGDPNDNTKTSSSAATTNGTVPLPTTTPVINAAAAAVPVYPNFNPMTSSYYNAGMSVCTVSQSVS